MEKDGLKKKTVNGLVWSVIDNFSSLGISFVFGIILARLLTPKDYGTIALLTIFIAISNVFINSGFSNALIRKPDLNEFDKSTAFYFNIIVGVVSYVILYLIAPVASWFYDLPILTPLLRVIAFTLIFNSLAIIQQTELSIKIDFKKQAYVSVLSALTSGAIGLYFAYNGFGVWTLAIQQIVYSFIRMLFLWLIVKWRPTEHFSKESFHYLFGFGSKLLASGLLDTIWVNMYPIIIGKIFSPFQLGLYSRADHFAMLPSSNLSQVIQRVTFPVLSSIQTDSERLGDAYRKLLKMSAFIIFPCMILLATVAYPLIKLLLTDKWIECVIYLQIICFALMWYPIHSINLNLLQVKGRSDIFFKLEIIKKIIDTIILICSIPCGMIGLCIGLVVSSIISLVINTFYTGKLINVGFIRQMKDVLPIFMASLIMGCIVHFTMPFFQNTWLQLIGSLAEGVLLYIIISNLFAHDEFAEIIKIRFK